MTINLPMYGLKNVNVATESLYTLDITIHALPLRINEGHGSSWQARFAESRKWKKLVDTAIGPRRPKTPLNRAHLTIIRASSRSPDYNGLASSMKVIEDALKTCGIIEDDNMKVIGTPSYMWLQAPPKKGFLRIIVQELTE